MTSTSSFLNSIGLSATDEGVLPASELRFPDGGQYRVEIPSVEGPAVMSAVLAEAERRGVPVHRLSQGSGGLLTTDVELDEMVRTGHEASVDLTMFLRPLAGWGIGAAALSPATNTVAQARGSDQLGHQLEELRRLTDAGVRSALVTDLGVVDVVAQMRKAGELPADLKLKGSVQMGLSNPASVRLGERIGLDTYNTPSDLTLGQLAGIRQATEMPLDIYLESPDNMGGFVRYYEIAEIIRVAAPVYVKFGLRNSPDIYPSGTHLQDLAVSLGVERVRRAQIGLEILERYYPDAQMSKVGAADIAVPQPGLPGTDARERSNR